MQIPRKEKWTKEDMIEYIKTCAKQYVPEWRYSQENPDAGTALVSLFADMMCDTVKRFNLSAVGDMFSFFDEVNAKMLPAKPAEGFITFGLPKGFEGEEEVLRGTKLLAETEEEPVIFETQEEVLVRQMNLKHIYLSNPLEDTIYQVYNQQQEAIPSFFLFQNKGRNLQQHKIIFCFSHGLEIQTDAKAKLSFQITGKNINNQEWEHALQEEESIYFSYGTAKGYQSIEKEYEENAIYFDIIGGENGISVKEEFQSSYIIQAEILDAELFSKIYFSSLTLSISSQNRKPDFIHVNGIDQEMEDFLVFGRTPSIYDEFYIVSEEVFGKIGAQIQIEFDLDFVKIPLELATEKKISWKTIMKKRDFIPEQEYDISICEVVWEYYNGEGWENGLVNELREDRLNGFVGKTVIHPKQIPFVNQAYMVSEKDYEDARAVLNWNTDSHSLVSGSIEKERMNEYKTHRKWAEKIMFLAEAYGISNLCEDNL